jgi:hypothetical protein
MIDLYDYKLYYRFKKYEKVTYNKVIFKKAPLPFNINKTRVILEGGKNFLGVDKGTSWFCWWEMVPTNIFKKVIYWTKFYPWYYTRFKKL